MTNEEMDRAIAEYLGYRVVSSLECGLFWLETPEGKQSGYKQGISEDHAWAVCCPKYSTDLNAMHEAEKTLTDRMDQDTYVSHLASNLYFHCEAPPTNRDEAWVCLHATARQRAEAFLRTIGKYSDATHPLP